MNQVKFPKAQTNFFDTLKNKVEDYFVRNNIKKKTGNQKLYTKTYVFFGSLILFYMLIMFLSAHPILILFLFALEGLALAGIGFNIMHDAAHGSYSSKPWVNNMMAHSLDMIGGSTFYWKTKHNIIHHTFTNIGGVDDDIEIPFMRTTEQQERKWYHRFQHIYSLLLYCFQYLFWVFYADFKKYFTGKINGISAPKMKTGDHFIFWIAKVLSIFVLFVLPIMILGWKVGLMGIAVLFLVTGVSISMVFQMAHLVEERDFPVPEAGTSKMEDEWAIHQVKTTANFATRNKFLTWVLGGLNFQVEHHLFPRISHIHYPALNKIVKETCTEFKLPYGEFNTFRGAMLSHLRLLRSLGRA